MKRILLTGASGFLGRHIYLYMQEQGYSLATLGRGASNDYALDLGKTVPGLSEPFDAVIHAAGLAHFTPRNQAEAAFFEEVNYQGTINLCRALEQRGLPVAMVYISTVAVYGLPKGEEISEDTPLNGTTLYAASKIKAEAFLREWSTSQQIRLAILRPALIAGPHPPGNLGAMVKAIQTGRYFPIRGNTARKSMVMADDVARIIPAALETGGIFNLTGDQHPAVSDLEKEIARQLGQPLLSPVPRWLACIAARAGDLTGSIVNSAKLQQLTTTLTFSNERAKLELGFQPMDVLRHFKINN